MNGFPGLNATLLSLNMGTQYMQEGETAPHEPADRSLDVFQDVTVSFFLLLAIYFPAVTGIMTG